MTFSETHAKFQNFPWDVSVLQRIVRSIRTEIRKLAKKQKVSTHSKISFPMDYTIPFFFFFLELPKQAFHKLCQMSFSSTTSPLFESTKQEDNSWLTLCAEVFFKTKRKDKEICSSFLYILADFQSVWLDFETLRCTMQ